MDKRSLWIAPLMALCWHSGQPRAEAQQLGLPKVEGLNVFLRGAEFSPSSAWRAENRSDACPPAFPMCGWGFETHYRLSGSDQQGAGKRNGGAS